MPGVTFIIVIILIYAGIYYNKKNGYYNNHKLVGVIGIIFSGAIIFIQQSQIIPNLLPKGNVMILFPLAIFLLSSGYLISGMRKNH